MDPVVIEYKELREVQRLLADANQPVAAEEVKALAEQVWAVIFTL